MARSLPMMFLHVGVSLFLLFVGVLGRFRARSLLDDNRQQYCERPWPRMDFFLPIGLSQNSDRNAEWSDVMLKSVEMFWPVKSSKLTIQLVLDVEVKDSDLQRRYVDSVINNGSSKINFPKFRIHYHTAHLSYKTGHDRQQHMMFYADQYSDAEYVGFVDGDCLFITNIDREDIFEEGKPIVHGNIGYLMIKQPPRSFWPTATFKMLGLKQPMICMSYFPVVVKREHFALLREHVEKLHGVSFDQVFSSISSGGKATYSQFNIMCTYMFWKHREDYQWYMHDTHPNWDGVTPAPLEFQWSNKSVFTEHMMLPKPFVAAHARYRFMADEVINNPVGLNKFILQGVCTSNSEPNPIVNCSTYNAEMPYFLDMHRFEMNEYNQKENKEKIMAQQKIRLERFRGCDLSYTYPAVEAHLSPYNLTQQQRMQLLDTKHIF